MSLIAEILAGGAGVVSPEPITEADIRAIGGLAQGWRTRLQLWMFGGPDHPAGLLPWQPPAIPGWGRCWAGLTDVVQLEPVVQSLVDGGQTDVALEVMGIIQGAREALLAQFPTIEVEEVGGNIRVPPAEDEAADWLATVAVVDSAEQFIRELEFGTIEDRQVTMFSATYPEIFKLVHETVNQMAQDAKARNVSVPWAVQDVILRAALIQEPQQPAQDKPAEEAQAPTKSGGFKAADELTAAQKTGVGAAAL